MTIIIGDSRRVVGRGGRNNNIVVMLLLRSIRLELIAAFVLGLAVIVLYGQNRLLSRLVVEQDRSLPTRKKSPLFLPQEKPVRPEKPIRSKKDEKQRPSSSAVDHNRDWLDLGEELFIIEQPWRSTFFSSIFGRAKRRSPRISCHDLDELKYFSWYQKTRSAKLFTDCMDDLEEAQRAFRQTFPDIDEMKCSSPRDLLHATWNGGRLTHSAMLGIVSFVRAYPQGCVRVKLWTTDVTSQAALSSKLRLYVGDAVEVLILDISDLCDRITSAQPDLANLISSSRWSLQKLGHPRSEEDWAGFSDIVRIFVLAAYGGVYLDCDMLLLRPLTPLLSHDFYYRWSFTRSCNTAAMHLHLGSPNAAKLIRVALHSSNINEMRYTLHPERLYRAITKMKGTIELLPSAYFDPLWIVVDVYGEGAPAARERYGLASYKEFFSVMNSNGNVRRDPRRNFFPGAFAFHWHNQWDAIFEIGSTAHLFMHEFKKG